MPKETKKPLDALAAQAEGKRVGNRTSVNDQPLIPLGMAKKSASVPPKPLAGATRKTPSPKASQAVSVTFVMEAPHAKQVSLCGEFNNWSPDATPMKRQEGGRWIAILALPPGLYQYKFVCDGQWLHDPKARMNVPNEHRSLNSVVEVRS
jgi:hypothetical protein